MIMTNFESDNRVLKF